jgi:hypothetical protein
LIGDAAKRKAAELRRRVDVDGTRERASRDSNVEDADSKRCGCAVD